MGCWDKDFPFPPYLLTNNYSWAAAKNLKKARWIGTLETMVNNGFPNQFFLQHSYAPSGRLDTDSGSIALACLLPSALSVPEDSNQSRYLVPWAFCISTFAYFPSNYVQLFSIDGHQHQFDSLLTYRCSNYLHNL